jgi:acetate kinase
MLGLSGISSDMRDIEDAIERGNPQAILAMDIYATRVAETIGSYFVRLGGLDVITFTGGIGENGADLRRDIISKLSAFGVELNEEINQNRKLGTPRTISTENSKIEVAVIATDEEFQIANECEKF